MCGRFTLTISGDLLADFLGLGEVPAQAPRWNIAPTQSVLAVRQSADAPRPTAANLSWGLVPSWAKDVRIAYQLLNARSETVADKPAFRAALRRRRCLIPADGFYEWLRQGKTKQPFCFRLRDNRPFAFAGLWESWQGPDGPPLQTCTILTTEANDLVRPVHDRMPVILPSRCHAEWLDPAMQDPERLRPMLRPFPADQMHAFPVSPWVSNPRNEGPRCLEKGDTVLFPDLAESPLFSPRQQAGVEHEL
jgi:putative SOS response-associated peptidase YedK